MCVQAVTLSNIADRIKAANEALYERACYKKGQWAPEPSGFRALVQTALCIELAPLGKRKRSSGARNAINGFMLHDPTSGMSMSALESLPDRATRPTELLDSPWLSADIALTLHNKPSELAPRALFRMYFAALTGAEATLARKKAFTSAKMRVSTVRTANGSKVLVLKPSVEAAIELAQQRAAAAPEGTAPQAVVEVAVAAVDAAAGPSPVVADSDVDEDETAAAQAPEAEVAPEVESEESAEAAEAAPEAEAVDEEQEPAEDVAQQEDEEQGAAAEEEQGAAEAEPVEHAGEPEPPPAEPWWKRLFDALLLPQRRFEASERRLPDNCEDYDGVVAQLHASEPDAKDVAVWRVRASDAPPPLAYEAHHREHGNEHWLWHSPGKDPLTLLRSDHFFDHTYGNGGSYGNGTYFSEHAIYGGRILPCRVSELDAADGSGGQPPNVGDDVLLDGEGSAVFNVISCDGANYCLLRQLRWDCHGRAAEPCHKDVWRRLGDGAGDSTLWRSADVRYAILTKVSLGKCHEYGSEDPERGSERLRRPPGGCQSVSGTESDLNIIQVANRIKWYPEWEQEFAPLRDRGHEYGLQYAIWHPQEQACPEYIVRYRRKRVGPPPPPPKPSRKKVAQQQQPPPRPTGRNATVPKPGDRWQCMSCNYRNTGDVCEGVLQGGTQCNTPCAQGLRVYM